MLSIVVLVLVNVIDTSVSIRKTQDFCRVFSRVLTRTIIVVSARCAGAKLYRATSRAISELLRDKRQKRHFPAGPCGVPTK